MITIALYGLLGYETAYELFRLHEEELKKRFSKRFLEDFSSLANRFCIDADCTGTRFETVFYEDPFCYMMPIGEGGLPGALWRMCEEIGHAGTKKAGSKPGCRVDLLRVPVKQEIVEICELFGEDPYEVPSAGCRIVVCDDDTRNLLSGKSGVGAYGDLWPFGMDGTGRKYGKELLSILEQSVIIGKLTNDGRRVLVWDDMVRFLTPPQRQKKDMMDRKNEVHTC